MLRIKNMIFIPIIGTRGSGLATVSKWATRRPSSPHHRPSLGAATARKSAVWLGCEPRVAQGRRRPSGNGDETKAALLRLADLVRRSGQKDPKSKKRPQRGRSSGDGMAMIRAYEECRDLVDAPRGPGQTIDKIV